MAVPFILLGGAALAGITGAVKSVSAHTKNANAKQIVAEAQNIYCLLYTSPSPRD